MTRVALMLDVLGDRRGSAGNVRHLLEIARELQELGHQVVLVAHDHDPDGPFDFSGIELRAVNVGPVLKPAGARAILSRYWSGMEAMAALVGDVEVVNPYDWPSLRAGRLAAQRLGVPLVWTRNDETIWERALFPASTARGPLPAAARLPRAAFGLLDLRDARAAETIVVLSDHDAAMARSAYRRPAEVLRIGPAERFYEAPDRSAARRSLGVDEDELLVLGFALLVAHRRFEDLIDAVELLGDHSVRALIAGSPHLDPGYADALEARIADRHLGRQVGLARASVSDERLQQLYAAADIYVFPSARQSYGQAPLEALATGTPVIVSSGAGVSEVLRGRPGVEIVPPGDPQALAAAITAVRATGRGAVSETRTWMRSTLTNRAYAQRTAAIYAEAIARRARRT